MYIYRLPGSDIDMITPVFTHQGHEACRSTPAPLYITHHTWHPTLSDLLLSTATDGSLHAWQPNIDTGL